LCSGHEAGEEHVEVYHEALAADGSLLYVLAKEGGVTNGAPAALDGRPLLEPYPALEVSWSVRLSAWLSPHM